jgi:hypothetical protein
VQDCIETLILAIPRGSNELTPELFDFLLIKLFICQGGALDRPKEFFQLGVNHNWCDEQTFRIFLRHVRGVVRSYAERYLFTIDDFDFIRDIFYQYPTALITNTEKTHWYLLCMINYIDILYLFYQHFHEKVLTPAAQPRHHLAVVAESKLQQFFSLLNDISLGLTRDLPARISRFAIPQDGGMLQKLHFAFSIYILLTKACRQQNITEQAYQAWLVQWQHVNADNQIPMHQIYLTPMQNHAQLYAELQRYVSFS